MSDLSSPLSNFYTEAWQCLAPRRAAPAVEAEFYPYVGLNHTIRLRSGRIFVRVSDLLADAPDEVQQALAFVLVAKLLRQPVPRAPLGVYRAYASQPQLLKDAETRRRENGRKLVTSARGTIYDLDKVFQRLNRRYFDGALATPTLSWSQRETSRIFGHHDGTHDTIVISRTLDAPDVPDWVVEFVLYHEMLHIKHPVRVINGRRFIHTAAFRADERRFPQHIEAQAWLEKLADAQRRPRRRQAAKKVARKVKLFD